MSNGATAAAVFAAALLVYVLNGDVLPGPDARPNVEMPANVLKHGRLTFSPRDWPAMFVWKLQGTGPDEVVMINRWQGTTLLGRPALESYDDGSLRVARSAYYLGKSQRTDASGEPLYVGSYGFGAGLTALPTFVLAQSIGFDLDEPRTRWYLGKLTASLCAAGVAALAFLIARFQLGVAAALWVTVALAFGTCLWSASSQTLWQHGPSELFLLLGTWSLLSRPATPWRSAAAGAAYAWATVCRPTSAAALALAGLYLLLTQRRMLLPYCVAAAAPLLLLFAHNTYYLGSPWSFGQLAEGTAVNPTGESGAWTTPFWLGAAGQLFSPSRGVLVYSPFLVAAFAGIWLAWRTGGDTRFRFIAVVALTMLFADMKWFNWWGGWSFGYRMKVDAAVMLALLLIPAMPLVQRYPVARVAFLLALLWSIGVQWLGAFAYDFEGWNNRSLYLASGPGHGAPIILTPDQARNVKGVEGVTLLGSVPGNVDDPTFGYRLWTLHDSQILYYATHYSEARANKHRLMQAAWK